ncbi:hypothetical protein ECPA34_2850, partial [Escherichia coli PA34]
MGGNLFHCPKD